MKISVPACLANPDLGEHNYLRTASGLRFHYVAKGDPAKPLMLFVHGYPEVGVALLGQLCIQLENLEIAKDHTSLPVRDTYSR